MTRGMSATCRSLRNSLASVTPFSANFPAHINLISDTAAGRSAPKLPSAHEWSAEAAVVVSGGRRQAAAGGGGGIPFMCSYTSEPSLAGLKLCHCTLRACVRPATAPGRQGTAPWRPPAALACRPLLVKPVLELQYRAAWAKAAGADVSSRVAKPHQRPHFPCAGPAIGGLRCPGRGKRSKEACTAQVKHVWLLIQRRAPRQLGESREMN